MYKSSDQKRDLRKYSKITSIGNLNKFNKYNTLGVSINDKDITEEELSRNQ